MSKTLKCCLLAGACWAAATVAYAEAAPAPSTLEELVVTAQKRAENIQDAPLTVQALSAKTIQAAGALGTLDLQTLVPGLTFNNNLTAAIPYIRGVGQNTGSLGVESPVAVYIDGVYLVAPASGLFSFNNIERIEVDKGPQGTLFGRNTTGGVIQVVTKAPSHTFDWNAAIGYGNLKTSSADGYITGEVAPNLAASLSAYGENQREGYIDNLFLKRKVGRSEAYGVQNRWLWSPSSTTDLDLNLMYNWKYGYQGTTNAIPAGMVADDRVTTFAGDYTTFDAIPTPNRDSQALAALTLHQDLGWARITNIVSYHRLWDRFNFVQNAEPLHTPFLPGRAAVTQYIHSLDATTTEEFQIQAPAQNDFQWILGAFYLFDKTSLDVLDYRENQFIFQGSGSSQIAARQKTRSYAIYMDGSKTIWPDTRLTLGVRYTEDRKRVYGEAVSITATGALSHTTPASPGGVFAPLQTPQTWGEWSYRAVLDHHFTPDIMGYASYNRGFKSGLYNISVFFNQPVNPETVDAYEVGLKNELFEHRLRLNASAFYYDYQQVQLRQTVSAFPGRFILFNAATAKVKGVDVDFTAAPNREWTITGGFEVLDAKYTQFPGAPFAVPNPVTLPLPAGCSVVGAALPPAAAFLGGNTTVACNASDTDMIRSPHFTGNLGVQYKTELSGGSGLRLDVNDHYNSGFFWDVDHLLKQRAYHDLTAAATWTSPSGKFDVSIWGRNLTDALILASATAGATSTYAVGQPRTYGVTLRVRH